MIRVGVKILPKNEVLDSQGRTVAKTLQSHGHDLISCRMGKYVILEFEENDPKVALSKAHKMADFILCNSLIETYEAEVL